MPGTRSWLPLAALALSASATIPDVVQSTNSHFKTLTVTYDTYTLPAAGMFAWHGIVPGPCDDCTITSMSASLNYPNGTRADLDTGVLLHHAVLLNLAKTDRECDPWKERFFWSGNERTVWDLANDRLPGSRKDFGYHLASPEGLFLVLELMNMKEFDQDVVFAVTFELTEDKSVMRGMKNVAPYWLDVASPCSMNSEVPNLEGRHFQYTGHGVTVADAGQIAVGYGHTHQGGTNLTVSRGEDVVCEFFVKHAEPSEGGHVKSITRCQNAGRVQQGDVFTLTGNYDTDVHAARRQPDGSLEPTMGLVMLYVVESDGAPGVPHDVEHEEESQGSKEGAESSPRPALTTSPMVAGVGAVALLGVGYVCVRYFRARRRRQRPRSGSKVNGETEESVELMKEDREED